MPQEWVARKKKPLRSGGRGSEITQGLVDLIIGTILPCCRHHVKTRRAVLQGHRGVARHDGRQRPGIPSPKCRVGTPQAQLGDGLAPMPERLSPEPSAPVLACGGLACVSRDTGAMVLMG